MGRAGNDHMLVTYGGGTFQWALSAQPGGSVPPRTRTPRI